MIIESVCSSHHIFPYYNVHFVRTCNMPWQKYKKLKQLIPWLYYTVTMKISPANSFFASRPWIMKFWLHCSHFWIKHQCCSSATCHSATNVERSCNLSNDIKIVKLMRRIAANNANLALKGVDLWLNNSRNSHAKWHRKNRRGMLLWSLPWEPVRNFLGSWLRRMLLATRNYFI